MRFSGWDRVATFGCGSQLIWTPWEYEPPIPGMYVTLCTYEPALGAWANCVDQVLRENISLDKERENVFAGSVKFANLVCRKAGGGLAQFTVDQFNTSLKNASHYLQDISNVTGKVTSPIKLDDLARRRTINAVRAEFKNLDISNDNALWVYYYFAIIFVIMFFLQFSRIKNFCIRNKFINRFRAQFELPTLWSTAKHTQAAGLWALGGLVPTSLEATLLAGFFIVHTIALCLNYSIDHEEVLEEVYLQYLQAIGNRSGIISFGLLPLIIVFSTRSILVQKLTGLRYTSFLVLHRWIGRLIVVDAVIHSIAFYYHERFTGALQSMRPQLWWRTGVFATWVSCFIAILAIGAFRSRFYETFLYTHIALAGLFFFFCWIHVKSFGWTSWVIIACILWATERLFRLCLMSIYGVSQATVNVVNDNILVLTVPQPRQWKGHPTQYAFIYLLLPSIFWQSHPFTLVNTDHGELKAVIAVKSGATAVLKQAAIEKQSIINGNFKLPICLEGPYGDSPSLNGVQKVLLISGGSGIPGPLSMCRSLLRKGFDLHLVIAIRDIGLLDAYKEEICSVIHSQEAKVDIHYTGPQEERTDSDVYSLINHRTRPDVSRLVQELAVSGMISAVMCCGPPVLNDLVRNDVAMCLRKNPHAVIEYFEEYQVW